VTDPWARWLHERRHGGDPAVLDCLLPELLAWRDGVLENAALTEGDTVLDVGTGEGLIGLGALDRVGEKGRVIFSDISDELLQECRRAAEAAGALDRCEFVYASADELPLEDEAVDVVTTRSALIYLREKLPAFREFFRVLRPGGRLSIFEPINSFGFPEPEPLYRGLDVTPVLDLARRVRAVGVPPSEHPLLGFDERDLLAYAEHAGFRDIRLDYRAEVTVRPHRGADCGWETYKRISGNPLDPTLQESLDRALTPEERERFEQYLRPLVEGGAPVKERRATVLLRGIKGA
jgi:arsenite methyltransferase